MIIGSLDIHYVYHIFVVFLDFTYHVLFDPG